MLGYCPKGNTSHPGFQGEASTHYSVISDTLDFLVSCAMRANRSNLAFPRHTCYQASKCNIKTYPGKSKARSMEHRAQSKHTYAPEVMHAVWRLASKTKGVPAARCARLPHSGQASKPIARTLISPQRPATLWSLERTSSTRVDGFSPFFCLSA